ncbi:hypothetical protein CRG98_023870 [Punica granatum]|uniref:Uncharacterized protein n=1 Tax=Punica granatum TaxID=22663 RepID=A0A2I0JHJ5_PUNGR|nr:hypothetical protein CRG98_023870 [Punica granatum]
MSRFSCLCRNTTLATPIIPSMPHPWQESSLPAGDGFGHWFMSRTSKLSWCDRNWPKLPSEEPCLSRSGNGHPGRRRRPISKAGQDSQPFHYHEEHHYNLWFRSTSWDTLVVSVWTCLCPSVRVLAYLWRQ